MGITIQSVGDVRQAAACSGDLDLGSLIGRRQDHYVVMCHSVPVAVIVPLPVFESMQDELDDLRVMVIAGERLARPVDERELIAHEEMAARYREEG